MSLVLISRGDLFIQTDGNYSTVHDEFSGMGNNQMLVRFLVGPQECEIFEFNR